MRLLADRCLMEHWKARSKVIWLGLALAIIVVVILAIALPTARRRHTAVRYLARAIEGEGAGLFENREQVGTWIAHTVLNRVDSSWWPNTVEAVVVAGFYGHARVSKPAGWAMDLAREAMGRKEDQARGAVFLLSGDDLQMRGWSAESAIRCFRQGEYALCFFREWPGVQDSHFDTRPDVWYSACRTRPISLVPVPSYSIQEAHP